jgi:hypothetical protein
VDPRARGRTSPGTGRDPGCRPLSHPQGPGDEDVDLAGLLTELAGDLDGLDVVDVAGGVGYRRDGRLFATLAAAAAEFRLRSDVARAVLTTPDVSPSQRGGEWVRFAPPLFDRFARDRAEAWFLSAWRLAGER